MREERIVISINCTEFVRVFYNKEEIYLLIFGKLSSCLTGRCLYQHPNTKVLSPSPFAVPSLKRPAVQVKT